VAQKYTKLAAVIQLPFPTDRRREMPNASESAKIRGEMPDAIDETLTVAGLLATVGHAVTAAMPDPVWVRGEVAGLHRTGRGAVFFRLADAEVDDAVLEVAARGRVMQEIDHVFTAAGVGSLRSGIEVRVLGEVALDPRRSMLRLSLAAADPAYTMGRIALDREEVLRRMSADGSIEANGSLPIPLVPLRIGLVTSRGSAAHADFIEHLERSRFGFSVTTAHTMVQGEAAPAAIAAALSLVGTEPVDVVALIRGGGSKLDLAAFDSEVVGRAVAGIPVPVVTGIGHEIDRTVADAAAAVARKTPTDAAGWLVSSVQDFADRIGVARRAIPEQARWALSRMQHQLDGPAGVLTTMGSRLRHEGALLSHLADSIADVARGAVANEKTVLTSLDEWFATIGVESTLARGFALVTKPDGSVVVRSVAQVGSGDRLVVRFSDGTVPVVVEEP
jgi:exodeoxyribonuclease VII large subunit